MKKQTFERYDGSEVTDSMLQEASLLFNENYGVWGKEAVKLGAFAKPGKSAQIYLASFIKARTGSHVKLSTDRLRSQCLPCGATCSYVRVTVDDRLAGNVFACRWTCKDKNVCWITQLVVHRDYRERGLATCMLNQLRQDEDDICGVMSSHPATCLATAKAFGS
jgi:hypothetical protein